MGKLPEILFLMREKVEKEADIKPTTPDEFADLVDYINNKLKEMPVAASRPGFRLSEKTIRRLWEKEKYDSAPSLTTLNMLSKVAGYKRWEDFEKKIADYLAGIAYGEEDQIPIYSLKIGERIVLGKYPEKYLFMEYLGEKKFQVLFYVGKFRLASSGYWYYSEDF